MERRAWWATVHGSPWGHKNVRHILVTKNRKQCSVVEWSRQMVTTENFTQECFLGPRCV